MADQTDDENTEVLDQQQDDDQADDQDQDDADEGESRGGDDEGQEGGEEGAPADGESDDGVVVTLGDEAPPASDDESQAAPQWVKDLRKEHRELQRQKRELEQKLAEQTAGQQQAPQLLKKPTLEECDFDTDEYERRFTAYQDQQRRVQAEQEQRAAREHAEQEAWHAKLAAHDKGKQALKVPDYDDAEEVVKATFNVTQQAILLQGAENSALLAYAIGKSPAKAKELASITDPVKFAFALAKLENTVKVTPRKAPPPPEKNLRGSAPGSSSVDSQLARLEAEADRTGDRTKVVAFRRQMKQREA